MIFKSRRGDTYSTHVEEGKYIQYTVQDTVGYATANDARRNECYNWQFLSIKSRCYNERGGILSADVARALA